MQSTEAALPSAIENLLDDHFSRVHQRVPDFYSRFFISPGAVLNRHWRHKKDVPRDLAHIPVNLYRLARRIARRPASSESLSGKDRELMELIMFELMALPQLEAELERVLREEVPEYAAYQQELNASLKRFSLQEVSDVIEDTLHRINIPREGSRELILFVGLGLLGSKLSHNVAFGSSLGVGSSLATTLYLSHQSWLGGLWVQVTGVPGWVSVAGAAGGLLAVLVAAPLITPFSELAVNRLKGETQLHRLVERVRTDITTPRHDGLHLAGYIASYVQALPDLIQALRMLRT